MKTTQSKAKENEIREAELNPKSGHYYKRIGNEQYTKGEITLAIENYNKAIKINDTESIFYSNRARCYKMLRQYDLAYEDTKQAIELDDTNIKAHLLCGQILAEMAKSEKGYEKIDQALSKMTKALTLCAGQGKKDFERDLMKNILRVNKLRWYRTQEIITTRRQNALQYLETLIKKDNTLNERERINRINETIELINLSQNQQDFNIPEYLCCKITLDLMEDPVTTQAGHTYEKIVLLEHFRRNGFFDPVTREQISSHLVYPNLNIKQAIEIFLKENPWAFEYRINETISDIKF